MHNALVPCAESPSTRPGRKGYQPSIFWELCTWTASQSFLTKGRPDGQVMLHTFPETDSHGNCLHLGTTPRDLKVHLI
eukprot:9487552-Ditylum_brightwellii.AAC.1